MSCYGCARDIGHEAECPNEGVYAKRFMFNAPPTGTSTGTTLAAFALPREAPKAELRFLGTESFTLAPGKGPLKLPGWEHVGGGKYIKTEESRNLPREAPKPAFRFLSDAKYEPTPLPEGFLLKYIPWLM